MYNQSIDMKLSPVAPEFLFSENEELVEALKRRYPFMQFEVSLSLGQWANLRNLHKLPINYVIKAADLDNPGNYFRIILDALFDFFDAVSENMHRTGIKKATVQLSRIEIGGTVSTTTLKQSLYGNLRAVFIQE